MRKLLLAGVWLAALAVTGMLGLLAYEVSRRPPPAQPMTVERLPRRQPHNRWARWTVTEHLSAHRVLIAHVETDYLHEARAIAQQIADPIKTRYAEVLIYFHRPGRPDTLPPRKVTWTVTTGYVETVYE
jgi:hypothetical protein